MRDDRGVVIGLALLFGSAVLVGLFLSDGWRIGGDNPGGWIYEYQGLIGGTLAVAGAVTTVWFLRRQIQVAKETAERARRVDMAALNRPLVDRLDRVVEDCNATVLRLNRLVTPDGTFPHDPATTLQRTPFGAELRLIRALFAAAVEAREKIIEARAVLKDWGNGGARQQAAEDALTIAQAYVEELADLATVIARLLAAGWSPLELSHLTAEEIQRFKATELSNRFQP